MNQKESKKILYYGLRYGKTMQQAQRISDLIKASDTQIEIIVKPVETITVMKEALEWYADKNHWTYDYLEGHQGDYGTRARKALEDLR